MNNRSKAYLEGYEAFYEHNIWLNPYHMINENKEFHDWNKGWYTAKNEYGAKPHE